MKQKKLLPKLTKEDVEKIIKFIKLNYSDNINWNTEYCCADDGLEAGADVACKTLLKGYDMYVEPPKEDEDE